MLKLCNAIKYIAIVWCSTKIPCLSGAIYTIAGKLVCVNISTLQMRWGWDIATVIQYLMQTALNIYLFLFGSPTLSIASQHLPKLYVSPGLCQEKEKEEVIDASREARFTMYFCSILRTGIRNVFEHNPL